MPFEHSAKILYKRYEELLDQIDKKEGERDSLERKVAEARAEVDKARSIIQSKIDRLSAEANELRSAMDLLGSTNGS